MTALLNVNVSDWLHEAAERALSPEMLEMLVLQLGVIAAMFAVALMLRLGTRGLTDRVAARALHYIPAAIRISALGRIVTLAYTWLLLVITERVLARSGLDPTLVGIAATLSALWIVLRASTALLRDALFARFVALVALVIAALDIFGILGTTTAALDSIAMTLGTIRISLLLVVKAVLIIAILLRVALAVARLISMRLQRLAGLSPSIQTLAGNLLKIVLITLAFLIGLNTVGIDLTALAVFSGAIGVGLGFGLQKIVSNFVSGIILLLEHSIKPGDVIEVGHAYGTVTSLGARYATVHGRDSKEYLIPNETLITNQVTNWSYSSPMLRLDVRFGVGYGSDLRQVRRLATEAAQATRRVIASSSPVCHITEFGDNAVQMLLRFWIEDPANGIKNVTGEVYLELWDRFREHGIELPAPQREIRIRESPAAFFRSRQQPAAE